jgi:cytochrome c556
MRIALMIGRAACLAGAVLVAAGLGSGQARVPASYMYTLMVNMVGPSANSLWETVGVQTISDQDWQRMKQAVARLTESAPAVSAGGTSAVETERAKSNEWKTWSGKFIDVASAAARAVDRKDQMALVAASDTMVEVCEGCHTAFPPAAAQ